MIILQIDSKQLSDIVQAAVKKVLSETAPLNNTDDSLSNNCKTIADKRKSRPSLIKNKEEVENG